MAEKVSMALLTRAAFGTSAGLRHAVLSGVPPELIAGVFARARGRTRQELLGQQIKDRRREKRN